MWSSRWACGVRPSAARRSSVALALSTWKALECMPPPVTLRPGRLAATGVEGRPEVDGKKILVTGPAGHLTTPIVRELAKSNDVWGMARFSNADDRAKLEALGVTCLKKDIARDSLD